ncbi:hypothetical protein ACHQM5_023741 [Ranunculus cassubicifolius]
MASLISFFILLSTFSLFLSNVAGGLIGVNYGRIANNLPPPAKVVELLKTQGINQVKLYDTEASVLKALSGSNNIMAYYPSTQIIAIAVGNEVFVDPNNTTDFLVPAMKNVQAALLSNKLDSTIKISSPIALGCLQNSYPSSAGSFKPELTESVIKSMLDLIRQTGSHLMVNAYPFFAYESNSDVISLDYALFRENPGVVDSGNALKYFSLVEAQLDAVYAAMSALKYDDIKIVVSETGWPSKGNVRVRECFSLLLRTN